MRNYKYILLGIGLFIAVILTVLVSSLFVPKRIEVQFKVDDTLYKKVEVLKGKLVDKPNDPTKEGYKFIDWYLGNKKYDFNTKIKSNIILNAKFEEIEKEKEYTIRFDSNGGSIVSPQIITEKDSLTVPESPTKEGHVFLGWYYADVLFDFTTKVDKDITLVAKWQEIDNSAKLNTYTVTFNNNNVKNNVTVIENALVNKPSNPARNGYTFEGWYYNGNLFNFNTPIKENLELIAKWKKNETSVTVTPQVTKKYYTVTFDSNGGTAVSNSVVMEGEKVSKPSNPVRNGYTFEGWYYNNSLFNFNTAINKDMTLKANWKIIPPATIPVTSLTINKTSHTMNIGESISLSVVINPSNATNKSVVWTSENSNIASVSSNGTVTGKSAGTVKIIANVDGVRTSCTITIIEPVSYSYVIEDIPDSTTGQCYIFVKKNNVKISGKATIVYQNNATEELDIPVTGLFWANKNAIKNIINISE